MGMILKSFYRAAAWFGTGPNLTLIDAARSGDTAKVGKMLGVGADIHFNNEQPLRCAAVYRHKETTRLLLEAGADAHADNDGPIWCVEFSSLNVPVDSKEGDDYTEIIDMMKQSGPKPNSPSIRSP